MLRVQKLEAKSASDFLQLTEEQKSDFKRMRDKQEADLSELRTPISLARFGLDLTLWFPL